ncbi:TonB-dependent receptor [Undibacterium sp. TJN25]|uniref:TonB-dependent receptor n=1 Tax=Undibacterium sp. TJN25 TaxID=3413056 RepID=UPI003BEFFD4E
MLKEKILSQSVRMIFSGGIVVSMGLLAHPAIAQEETTQRVEITGSAIKRIDAEGSVPVTVVKIDDLKKQGITTIEQVMANLSAAQSQQSTSQVVGLSTGGASFADLRGIGANKTLVLLNGRRLANNAYDSSAPDLNMIPFAALERVEVLRDGASALYGSDAVGGVINFITKKDFKGFTITAGADSPQHDGGKSNNFNVGFGAGDLNKDGYNIFGVIDHQSQDRVGGTQRPFNTRYSGGLSPTTSPANYFQGGNSQNPTAPSCAAGTNLIPDGKTGCNMTTSSFVDYIPKSERTTALLKGTLKISENHELGVEYMTSQNNVSSQIAPVPYGGLRQNPFLIDGVTANPYYPGNSGNSFQPAPGTISNTYVPATGLPAGAQPGFVNVKWRDLPNGPRADNNVNKQERFITSLTGTIGAWDYDGALTWNQNKVSENLMGYSDGGIITKGVLNGIINPYGAQSAAGTALINSAALNGNIQNAKGTTKTADLHASRELGDWLGAGRPAALAIGGQYEKESFLSAANPDYAAKVVASTGIDPNTINEGSRNISALYAELNLPVLKTLDVTVAVREDHYSDFGSTTNPKVSFRFQPTKTVLLRGSYSTGFRAPSLYEINSSQTYTNTTLQNDPINCPGGSPIAGKSSAANCQQQFQSLTGGNKNLSPEKSKNATLGIVIEPIDNLTLGLDIWSIELRNAIGTLPADDVFANNVKYASLYHRNPAGDLATDGSQCPDPTTCGYVDLRTQNLGGTKTNGADISATYKLRAGAYGSYTFGLNSTYVNKYQYQNEAGGVWIQNVGVYSGIAPVFRWQHNATVNWTGGAFGAGLAAHYKSGYVDGPNDVEPANYHVPSYSTFDGYVTWNIVKAFSLTAGIRNLFDKDPPLSYQTQTFQAGYDPRFTDPLGRTYYLRGTFTY